MRHGPTFSGREIYRSTLEETETNQNTLSLRTSCLEWSWKVKTIVQRPGRGLQTYRRTDTIDQKEQTGLWLTWSFSK